MKKLTAGIFTVMLGLCAANNADAAVASKGYVDSFVGENGSITTEVATLKTTVADNKSAAETAIADAKKAGTDAAAAKAVADGAVYVNTTQQAAIEKNADDINAINAELDTMATSETVTNLTTRVTTAEGKITTAEGEIDGLQASLAEGGATSNAIVDAKQAGTKAAAALESYKTTNDAAVSANTSAISAINNAETGILAEAKKYADANDADTIYDDEEVRGLITANDTAIKANAQDIAENRLALAEKMNITSAKTETGKYVFTANVGENGVTDYAWELIAREGEDEGEE